MRSVDHLICIVDFFDRFNFFISCYYVGDEESEDSSDSARDKVYEVDEDGDLILTRRRSKFSVNLGMYLWM